MYLAGALAMHEFIDESFLNWWFLGSASSFIVWLLREKKENRFNTTVVFLWFYTSTLKSTLFCKIPAYQLQRELPAIEVYRYS